MMIQQNKFDRHKQTVLVMDFAGFFNQPVKVVFSKLICHITAELIIYIIEENYYLNSLEDYEKFLSQVYSYADENNSDPFFNLTVVFQSQNMDLIEKQIQKHQILTLTQKLQVQRSIDCVAQSKELETDSDLDKIKPIDIILNGITKNTPLNKYKRGANGGTFDKLHNGHKLLLSLSLLAVEEFLTVGISSDILLTNKKNKHLLQSFKTRRYICGRFLTMFKPSVQIDFAELQDAAGPTSTGDYQLLIVTEETKNALMIINGIRTANNQNILDCYCLSLVGGTDANSKLSSSQLREAMHNKNKLSPDMYEYLKKHWMGLVIDQTKGDKFEYWFEQIIEIRYSEKQRFYHTLKHIYNMIQWYDLIVDIGIPQFDSRLVLFSIFFHDIIYYPKENDNEERSALLWLEFAEDVQDVQPQTIKEVDKFILQTKSHKVKPTDYTEKLEEILFFMDMDLSILGSNPEDYKEYANDIRLEYSHYSTEDYKNGRTKVLQSFLEMDAIYQTPFFREKQENQAKINIQQEIQSL